MVAKKRRDLWKISNITAETTGFLRAAPYVILLQQGKKENTVCLAWLSLNIFLSLFQQIIFFIYKFSVHYIVFQQSYYISKRVTVYGLISRSLFFFNILED